MELAGVSPAIRLAVYAVAVVAATLGAALWPATRARSARLTHVSIPVSAGVMLGAVFFHMLPEAVAEAGPAATYGVVLGFVTLFLLERFVLVHACEVLPENARGHEGHAHAEVPAGSTLGIATFLGFSVHTLADGVALGAGLDAAGLGPVVLLAIVLHKIPLSFSLASVLRLEGRSRGRVLWMVTVFALMVPVGAGIYLLAADWLEGDAALLVTPYALAFSAGTFLHVSFSDLLPEVNRRRMGALPAVGLVSAGLAVMYVLTWVSEAGHVH